MTKPALRPGRPHFSSGPCAKRPGWTPEILSHAVLGRSHRSAAGKAKLAEVIQLSRDVLGMPADYRPASCRHPIPAQSRWRCVAASPAASRCWRESFSSEWAATSRELKLTPHVQGQLRRAARSQCRRLVERRCSVRNGTTSGVCVPDGNWIPSTAKASRFAMPPRPCSQWSCRGTSRIGLVLAEGAGGEAAHGMTAPRRARERRPHTSPHGRSPRSSAWPGCS